MDQVRTIEFAQHGVTNLHPIAIAFLVVMTGLVLSPRRSAATLGILAVCVFMPADQRVVIAGLDFSIFRLITIFALIRIFLRGEHRGLSFGQLDRVFLLWVLAGSLLYVLRVGPGGIVYRLGTSFDALTALFVIRALVRRRADVLALWRHLAWITLVLSLFLVYEVATERNFFGIFRYDRVVQATVRDGAVRATGPFSHPILAGTFGSVVAAAFFGIFLGRKKGRILFGTACAGATVITMTSGSSGPLMAWLFGALGWAMWRMRRRMRMVVLGVLFVALVIHFVREKPIWHLIVRLSSVTGGTGYHRYRLIDAFFRRFPEWALVGTDNTAYWGWGLQDTTNQYVAEGINGGLITLTLFIILLRSSFVRLRVARSRYEHLEGPTSLWALLAWGCSVSLAVHCFSFISVSYFGQMLNFFFIFVASLPALARFKRRKRVVAAAAASRTSSRKPQAIPATGLHSRG